MWHEITGAQLGLLLEVQRAWVREMLEIRSSWRLGKLVKQMLYIKPGPRVPENTFLCEHCKRLVPAVAPGARPRSHCPHCLWSLHVRTDSADRHADCCGLMEPVGVSTQAGGAWSLLHHCRQCDTTQANAVAVDDNGSVLLTVATRRPQPAQATNAAAPSTAGARTGGVT